MSMSNLLTLHLQRQELRQDSAGRNHWATVITPAAWPAEGTALLLCDLWDRHWSKGAMLREAVMLPWVNQVVASLRERGALIIHAPSNTLAFYEGTPARQRALAAAPVEPPAPREHDDPPLPVDASDGGSDTNQGDEVPHSRVWTRQHPDLVIDQERDLISDDGRQVYSAMCQRGIAHLLILGVHTNMCVLNRTFAIKQMVRWGVNVALVRDLTDAMYNPARPPYVSHDEGTRLVIEYIEKFWCPTVLSEELV